MKFLIIIALLFLAGCAPAYKGEIACTIPETTVYVASDYEHSSAPTMRRRYFLTKMNGGKILALSDTYNKAIWVVGDIHPQVAINTEHLGHEVMHLLTCRNEVQNPDY